MISPVGKAKSAVRRSDPADPRSFSCRSVALGHASRLRVSKVGQDWGTWDGVCGPVPHGHASVWESFQSEEVGEELAVPCSQPEDGDLLGFCPAGGCGLPQVPFAELPPCGLETGFAGWF